MRARFSLRHFALMLLLVCCGLMSGCATTTGGQGSLLDRMFPADPDDSFFGDQAREIDKRLSSSSPRVEM